MTRTIRSGPGRAFLCLLALANGCGAVMVETRRRVSGPVSEVGLIDPGGGHAKYALQGPNWMVRARRRDAFDKIAAFCSGAGYKVVDELEKSDFEAAFAGDTLGENLGDRTKHYESARYKHVYFECLAQ